MIGGVSLWITYFTVHKVGAPPTKKQIIGTMQENKVIICYFVTFERR